MDNNNRISPQPVNSDTGETQSIQSTRSRGCIRSKLPWIIFTIVIIAVITIPTAIILTKKENVAETNSTTIMMTTGEGSTALMLTTTKSSATTKNPSTTTTKEAAVAYSNGNYSFWPMENNAVDIISGLNGEGANSPTYVTPGITGSGYALKLIRTSKQYIKIPTFKSFVDVSFTVEMWIYPTILISGELFGLFTQYDKSSKDHSLQMMIRGLQLTLDFYGGGINGATSLTTNTWYHVAFVYDYPSKTQIIYLNGYQDGSHSPAGPYLGRSGSINIGMYQDSSSYNYFDGYIDQVSLTMAAKSADDILDDATLATWHSFDYGIIYDSGPNKLQGKAVGVKLAPGIDILKEISYIN
ncbi:unnamed protein product [Adineta steineri]|uniref:LamG-like jellyroll fold domain-containing protein n=1 Tax=Adineta steineri TaxID=433720 RepID=A0A818Z9J5_9BILA|nr:unnamed protein product [Adineta steineri]CAF3768175.1 unnamed protein product [Adineta steineri]